MVERGEKGGVVKSIVQEEQNAVQRYGAIRNRANSRGYALWRPTILTLRNDRRISFF